MDRVLLLVLVVQAIMMLAGIVFLLGTRNVITPRSVWWSFMLRDLLWLVLVVDQVSHLYHYDPIPVESTILLSFLITSLFLFNIVMRYKAHRRRMFWRAELLKLADKLEELRADDERRHGQDWQNIKPTPLESWGKR